MRRLHYMLHISLLWSLFESRACLKVIVFLFLLPVVTNMISNDKIIKIHLCLPFPGQYVLSMTAQHNEIICGHIVFFLHGSLSLARMAL